MSLWPRSPYVQLWLQEKQHDQNMAKTTELTIYNISNNQINVWVNGFSFILTSRLKIGDVCWGHPVGILGDLRTLCHHESWLKPLLFVDAIHLSKASDFEECLVTAYNIHQRVPWFSLLLFYWYLCKIISLVWVTGWEYSEFRPHDPNINFWDREFPQLLLG